MIGSRKATIMLILLIILIFTAFALYLKTIIKIRREKDAASGDTVDINRSSIFYKLSNAVIGLVVITLIGSFFISIFAIKRVHSSTERISVGFAHSAADLSEEALISDLEDQVGDQLGEKMAYVNESINSYMNDACYLQSFMNDIYKYSDRFDPVHVPDISMDMAGKMSLYKLLANKDVIYEGKVKDEAELIANIVKIFKPIKEANPEYVDLYVGTETGVLISYDDFAEIAADNEGDDRYYEYRQRDWYRLAKNNGEITFISRYVDQFIKGSVTSCAIPFFDGNGDFVGCIGIDIHTDDLYRAMVNSNVSDNMEAYIVTPDGRILACKDMTDDDPEGSFEGIDELISNLSGVGKDETVLYTVEEPEGICYIGASYIRHTNWIFVVKAPKEAFTKAASDIRLEIGNSVETVSRNFDEASGQVVNKCLIIFAVILLLTAVVVTIQSFSLIDPIRRLESDVRKFSNGDLSHRTKVDTKDEIGDLARTFNRMASSIQQYMETIRRVTVKEERIAAELSMAKSIQTNLLPSVFPAFPDRHDFDVYASMNTAKEVGGDFYDFFLIDEDHLAMVMADVSGKGVPASLYMAITKTLIKTHTYVEDSPEKVFNYVNAKLCENNQDDMFVTAWLGILDLKTGMVKACNAGHEYPAIMLPHEAFSLMKDKHTLPLGSMENIKFKQYEFMLSPGSKLFLYTDGVTEATNREEKLFGTDRMTEALNKIRDKAPEEILSFMKKSVDEFVGDAPQFDDFTMLCLQFNGKKPQEGEES